MKKFIVLYLSTVPASEQMKSSSPEQAKKGMEMWTAWSKKAGSAVSDLGTPLGNAKKVTKGGISSGSTQVTGYSIMQSDSMDKLIGLLKEHPHHMAPGASIEVLEALPMT